MNTKQNLNNYNPRPDPHFQNTKNIGNNLFYSIKLHNHFKIDVDVIAMVGNLPLTISSGVKPKGYRDVSIPRPLKKGDIVLVQTENNILLSKIFIEEDGMTDIHFGMNTAHYDISVSSEPGKSPLGTALPMLRIVNTLSKTIKLSTSGVTQHPGNIEIPPGKSMLYRGMYENGIPIGTIFTDVEEILQDFVVRRPVTDLFLGIVAPSHIYPYTGAKIGGDFDYTTSTIDFPLTFNLQYHEGSKIDRTYIPKNW